MLWVVVQMNLKTNIEATKEKYDGLQLASSEFATYKLWLVQACLRDFL